MTGLEHAWQSLRLREVGQWFGGGTPSKSNGSFWADGSIPWLSPKDMGRETLIDTQDHISESAVTGSAAKLVDAGSVAVVMRSGILERGFPVALVPFETTLNQDMRAVVPREGIDARWIAWGLRAFEREILRECRKAGTTVASIEAPRLMDFVLPIPPIDEQRRIVDILEDHLSRLDAAVGSLVMNRRRLVAYQRAALDGLTEGPATRHIALGDALAAVEAGKSFGGAARASLDDEWGIVKVSAMTWGEFRPKENKLVSDQTRVDRRYQIHAGDLLMSRANTSEYVGAPVLVRSEPARLLLSDKSLRLVPRDGVSAEYLWRVLSAPRARTQISDRASGNQESMRNISQATLKTIMVPWTDNQLGVIVAANELDDQRARMLAVIDRCRTRSAALRRALLQSAFSGQLTDPSSDLARVEESIA